VRNRRTVRTGRWLSVVMAAVVAVIVSAPTIGRPDPPHPATLTCGGPADPGWPGGPVEVSFQANTGSLWSTAAEGSADWSLGMMPGTSPAVAALAGGGFEIAFQANTGHLWTVGTAGCRDWLLGMMPGTSPAIAGLAGGGFEVAVQASTSSLWTVGSAGNAAWPLGMAPRTNPTLAAPLVAPFASSIRGIDSSLADRMRTSWRPGCPVPLTDLRYLTVTYRGFDGGDHLGELVVAAAVAPAVVEVFRQLHAVGYPLASLRLVDDFGGSDDQSMAADNSSAFNCRPVTGGTGFSEHSFGTAIDLNPVQNPYLSGTLVLPPQGRPFIARTPGPGVILPGDAVVTAFAGIGWTWGGTWTNPLDYMHFSASGR